MFCAEEINLFLSEVWVVAIRVSCFFCFDNFNWKEMEAVQHKQKKQLMVRKYSSYLSIFAKRVVKHQTCCQPSILLYAEMSLYLWKIFLHLFVFLFYAIHIVVFPKYLTSYPKRFFLCLLIHTSPSAPLYHPPNWCEKKDCSHFSYIKRNILFCS